MKTKIKSKWGVRTLAYLALLLAMNLVLTRALGINFGIARVSFGSVCTILAGLWFGPAAGGVVGLSADLLGCLFQGYAPNPFISVAAIGWGALPPLLYSAFSRKSTAKTKYIWMTVTVILTAVCSSLIITTIGLTWMNTDGGNYVKVFLGLLPVRAGQFALTAITYSIVTGFIYFSPVTNFIRNSGMRRPVKKTGKI